MKCWKPLLNSPANTRENEHVDCTLKVIEELLNRREKGLAEYGKPVNPQDPNENWLQHAFHEDLDRTVYMQAEVARQCQSPTEDSLHQLHRLRERLDAEIRRIEQERAGQLSWVECHSGVSG